MSPLSKDHLAELREELEAQLARLMRSIEASEAALEPVELDQSRVGRLSRMDELQNQSLTRKDQQERGAPRDGHRAHDAGARRDPSSRHL